MGMLFLWLLRNEAAHLRIQHKSLVTFKQPSKNRVYMVQNSSNWCSERPAWDLRLWPWLGPRGQPLESCLESWKALPCAYLLQISSPDSPLPPGRQERPGSPKDISHCWWQWVWFVSIFQMMLCPHELSSQEARTPWPPALATQSCGHM